MNFKILTLVFFLATTFHLNGQVFVNSSATGANNGSSWSNAYSSLSVAITNTPENSQFWIKAGTYKAGTTRADFLSPKSGHQFYGGFAGTETALSQRDIVNNITILSGDIAGNDITNNFTANRTDNSMHIVYIASPLTAPVTFDGLTFQNGHTADEFGSGNDRRGGAILSYSTLKISNCVFQQNYGHYGAAVYPRNAGAVNTEFMDCVFVNNAACYGSAIFMATTTGTYDNCTFDNNVCTATSSGNGAGAVAAVTTTYTMTNSTFTNNYAHSGAALYSYSSTGGGPASKVINSNFSNNDAIFGGVVQSFDPGVEIEFDNCNFTNNTATNRGGVASGDANSSLTFKNSTFDNNSAQYGGAIGVFAIQSVVVESCTFQNNGDANQQNTNGGAITIANSSSLSVTGSTFDSNVATDGGAVYVEDTNSSGTIAIISKSIFTNNSANLGAGINMHNIDLELDNSLIADNIAAATGGGIFLSASTIGTTNITNTTIANNTAPGAGGISQTLNGGAISLLLKNTILENTTANYQNNSPTGTPSVSTAGGNVSSDASLVSFLNGTNDLNNTAADFMGSGIGDYHLVSGSPAINNGVGTVTPTDLDGNPRKDGPDSGSYEYQGSSNTNNVKTNSLSIQIFPNPVSDILNLELNNQWKGALNLNIVDAKGAVVYSETIDKNQDLLQQSLNVVDFASGTYKLAINNGSSYEIRSFIVH